MVWIYTINEINTDHNKRPENMSLMSTIICFSYYTTDVVSLKAMTKIS